MARLPLLLEKCHTYFNFVFHLDAKQPRFSAPDNWPYVLRQDNRITEDHQSTLFGRQEHCSVEACIGQSLRPGLRLHTRPTANESDITDIPRTSTRRPV